MLSRCALRTAPRLESEAARLGIATTFADYRELLTMPGLDAVSVSGPHSHYSELAKAALEAGKHVLCEKPFAIDTKHTKELADLAAATGLTAMIAHEFRFTSSYARLKELLDEGYVGEPKFALVRLVHGPAAALAEPPPYVEINDSAAAGGGILFRMGSHYIDSLRFWFGEVVEVEGRLLSTAPERTRDGAVVLADADDTFFCTLVFESGVIVEMVMAPRRSRTSSRSPSPAPRGRSWCLRKGCFPHRTERCSVLVSEPTRTFCRSRSRRGSRPSRTSATSVSSRSACSPGSSCAGIEEGVSPHPNFLDAYRCVQVMEAVRESAATGHRVLVGE